MCETTPRTLRLLGDANHLVHGRDDADVVIALVADVARVDAAGLARERDHLLGLREPSRRVEQPAREPERAVGHGLADQRASSLEFSGRRIAAIARLADRRRRPPHRRVADARVADDERHVHADAAVRLESPTCCFEIGRPAAIRIADDERDALRDAAAAPSRSSARRRARSSACECTSMKPGATTRSFASIDDRRRWRPSAGRRRRCDRRGCRCPRAARDCPIRRDPAVENQDVERLRACAGPCRSKAAIERIREQHQRAQVEVRQCGDVLDGPCRRSCPDTRRLRKSVQPPRASHSQTSNPA